MERWIKAQDDFGEKPEIDAFLMELAAVCKKHGMSIGHEDGHGSFLVHALSDENIEWLLNASDDR